MPATDLTFTLLRSIEMAQNGENERATKQATRDALDERIARTEAEIVLLARRIAPRLTAKGGSEEMLQDAVERLARLNKARVGA